MWKCEKCGKCGKCGSVGNVVPKRLGWDAEFRLLAGKMEMRNKK